MSQSPPPASSVTGSISIPIRYMTNDDYIDSQNKQNQYLNHELRVLHEGQEHTNDKLDSMENNLVRRFDATDKKFDEKFDVMDKKFNAMDKKFDEKFDAMDKKLNVIDKKFDAIDKKFEAADKRFDAIDKKFEATDKRFDAIDKKFEAADKRFDELSARQDQFDAVFRNSLLNNPIMPIRPVVIFDPVKGRCHPDPHYFPKHADEFYALREMDNVRKRQQLIYLTEFYELVPPNSDYIVDNSFDTIARLETVLGLEEDRFIRFRERAQKYAYRSSEYSIKRTHNEYSELGQHLMPLIEALANEGKPSSPSVYTRVGWDTNPSPANKRPRIPLAPTGSAVATAAAAPTPAELDDLDAPTSAQPRLLSESTSAPPTDPEAPAELMSLPSTLPDRGSTTNPNTSVRASSDGRTSP